MYLGTKYKAFSVSERACGAAFYQFISESELVFPIPVCHTRFGGCEFVLSGKVVMPEGAERRTHTWPQSTYVAQTWHAASTWRVIVHPYTHTE